MMDGVLLFDNIQNEELLNHNNNGNISGIGSGIGFGKSCKDLEKELKGLESIINLKNKSFEQRLQQLSNDSKTLNHPQSFSPFSSSQISPIDNNNNEEEEQMSSEENEDLSQDEESNKDELIKRSKEKREIKKQKFEEELTQLKLLANQNTEKSEFEKIKLRYIQLYEDEKNNNKILKDKIKQLELEVIDLNKRLNKQNENATQKEVQLLNFQRKFPTLLQELELTSSHNSELLREKELLLSQYNDLRSEFLRYKDESYKQRTNDLQIKLELEQQNQKLSNEIFTLNNRLTESVLLVSELRGKRERDQEILMQESNKVSSLQQSLLSFERENKQLKLFFHSKFPNFSLFSENKLGYGGSYSMSDFDDSENLKLKIELQQTRDELFHLKSTNSSFSSPSSSTFSFPFNIDNNNIHIFDNNNNNNNNNNGNKDIIVDETNREEDDDNDNDHSSILNLNNGNNGDNHHNDNDNNGNGENNNENNFENIINNGDEKNEEIKEIGNENNDEEDDGEGDDEEEDDEINLRNNNDFFENEEIKLQLNNKFTHTRDRSKLSSKKKNSSPSSSASLSPSPSHTSSYSSHSSSDLPIKSKKKGKNYNLLEKYFTFGGEEMIEDKVLRPIIYTPVKGDEIDSLLANTISYNLADGLELLPPNFKRLTFGIYQFGTKKIHISVQNGQPVVRVGGGFSSFVKFVQKYGRSECIKITKQTKEFSPIENENTSPVKQILTPLRLKKNQLSPI